MISSVRKKLGKTRNIHCNTAQPDQLILLCSSCSAIQKYPEYDQLGVFAGLTLLHAFGVFCFACISQSHWQNFKPVAIGPICSKPLDLLAAGKQHSRRIRLRATLRRTSATPHHGIDERDGVSFRLLHRQRQRLHRPAHLA